MTTVEPIKSKKEIEKVKEILSKQSERNLLLFCFGINSGLRISDILKLNVEDVKNKDFIQLCEKKTKKCKKFPLNVKLKSMIKKFIQDKNDKEPLFSTIFKNRMDRFTAYRIINKACKLAQIQASIGTHTLRKTFGYFYYKKYKNILMLQKIFNHSNPNITLRYIGIEQEEIFKSYKNFML